MDPRHRTLAGLAALALFAAGCGGGDDNKSSGGDGALSKKEYIAQADKICQGVNDRLATLGTPQNVQQLSSYVQKALPQIDGAVQRLQRLKASDDIQPAAQELIANLEKQRDYVQQVGQKAKSQDSKALSALSKKAADFAQKTAAKAKAAGFETCGVPQGG